MVTNIHLEVLKTEKFRKILKINDFKKFKIPILKNKNEFLKYVKAMYDYIILKTKSEDTQNVYEYLPYLKNIILDVFKTQPQFGSSFFKSEIERYFDHILGYCHENKDIIMWLRNVMYIFNKEFGNEKNKLFKKSSTVFHFKQTDNKIRVLGLDNNTEFNYYNAHALEKTIEFFQSFPKTNNFIFNLKEEVDCILISDQVIFTKNGYSLPFGYFKFLKNTRVNYDKNKIMFDILEKVRDLTNISTHTIYERINIVNFYNNSPDLLQQLDKEPNNKYFNILEFKNPNIEKFDTIILANPSETNKFKKEINDEKTLTYIFFSKKSIRSFDLDEIIKKYGNINLNIKIYPGNNKFEKEFEIFI